MAKQRGIRSSRLSILLIVLVMALTACGEDGAADDETQESSGGTEPATVQVSAADFSFTPAAVSVPPGAEVTIEFQNTGDAPHTMTAEDVDLDVEAEPGATEEATFTAPESGAVEFHCEIHPDMKGQLVVEGSEPEGDGGGGGDGEEDPSYEY